MNHAVVFISPRGSRIASINSSNSDLMQDLSANQVSLGMLNLILAVIVERAAEARSNDQDSWRICGLYLRFPQEST